MCRGRAEQILGFIEECAQVIVMEKNKNSSDTLLKKLEDDDVHIALQCAQQMNLTQKATNEMITSLCIAKEYHKLAMEVFEAEESQRAASAFRVVVVCIEWDLRTLALKYANVGLDALLKAKEIPIEVYDSLSHSLSLFCVLMSSLSLKFEREYVLTLSGSGGLCVCVCVCVCVCGYIIKFISVSLFIRSCL
jgi:hypothetical protein